MAKKTFNIESFKDIVNDSLKNSSTEFFSPDRRQGMIDLLRCVLMESKQYRGFHYLNQNEIPDGSLPGILGDCSTPPEERFPEGKTDKTRVHFF